jgi:hypothetical protein
MGAANSLDRRRAASARIARAGAVDGPSDLTLSRYADPFVQPGIRKGVVIMNTRIVRSLMATAALALAVPAAAQASESSAMKCDHGRMPSAAQHCDREAARHRQTASPAAAPQAAHRH